MTSYDGVTISYDASGNPLNWTDQQELSWTGRKLDSIMSPDGATWNFKYDRDGFRTEREYSYSGDIIIKNEYTWVDGKLTKEYRSGGMLSTPITLEYYYDGDELIGFNYNGTDYYYGKTNLGEIRYIYDTSGNIVTTYLYDAWGAPISTTGSLASTVGAINLFRYKSYYYDAETGLYYLQSRCYDPQVGRFLNADVYIGTGMFIGYNMFMYCNNNPILFVDRAGNLPVVEYDDTAYPLEFCRYIHKFGKKSLMDSIIAFNAETEAEYREYIATGAYMSYEVFEALKCWSIVTGKPKELYGRTNDSMDEIIMMQFYSIGESGIQDILFGGSILFSGVAFGYGAVAGIVDSFASDYQKYGGDSDNLSRAFTISAITSGVSLTVSYIGLIFFPASMAPAFINPVVSLAGDVAKIVTIGY